MMRESKGFGAIEAILTITIIAILCFVVWFIWSSNSTITNVDKSISIISQYCNESRDSNIDDDIVSESRKKIIELGFSEGYVEKNFWPSSISEDKSKIYDRQIIEWHFCIDGFSGVQYVYKNNTNNDYFVWDERKVSDFNNLISVDEAIKRMQQCGGMIEENYIPYNFEFDYTLSVQFRSSKQYYEDPPEEKFNSAILLVSKKEEGRTLFGDTKVYVDLSDGSCYQAKYNGPV